MAENNPFPGENNTGHFWDDNLRELNNPAPRWWMIGFWASILWWIGYGILFPMWPTLSGNTKGILGWSQIQEYDEGVAQVTDVRAPFEEQIAGMTAEAIMADPGLTQYTLASAKVLFGDYCSACHGSGGQGNPGFPVLADDDWLYGGTPAKLAETLQMGRKGAMTAHKDLLTEGEVDTLANWVVALNEGRKGSDEGWNLFNTKGCTACHGADADGAVVKGPNGEVVVTVGAANLTDGIWRFEPGGYESAKHTILYGVNQPGVEGTRDAVMPAFGQTGKLDEQEIKKLVVYVHQLGGGQ
ncbi:MAG: cytochrome-c oxidase, cbb3-type subunit III [Chromatiaceae bacterium]|jgi:cytochrome c oxidase cbb3-type subunit 3|nr:cytochrome-c oxidase, cbb3-type subunit III [Chromatiaceae bacterium]